MAMSPVQGARGRTVSDINVTPMADVIIVLLIIFMVAISRFSRESTRELPFARNAEKEAAEGKVVISLSRLLTSIDGLHFRRSEDILPVLEARLGSLPEGHRFVLVKADQDLPYETVDSVVALCRQAGMEQIVLATAPLSSEDPPGIPGASGRP